MNFLRFALFGLLIVAGSMFVNIVPVSAAPQVTQCESAKLGILTRELEKTGLLSEHRRYKSGCLKYDGDVFETVLLYLGDFTSSDLQRYLPKLPIDHGQKIVLDVLTLVGRDGQLTSPR
jgi:hypothetical protein